MSKKMSPTAKNSHPDTDAFRAKGMFFDVGETDLDKYVGCKVIRKDGDGYISKFNIIYEIGEIQRIFDGSLAFRIYQCEDYVITEEDAKLCDYYNVGDIIEADTYSSRFGSPARPDEVMLLI